MTTPYTIPAYGIRPGDVLVLPAGTVSDTDRHAIMVTRVTTDRTHVRVNGSVDIPRDSRVTVR